MDMEQWLEEAMIVTNKSLQLMPTSIFKRCLDSCRSAGAPLVTIASAGSQLGLIDEAKLLQLKDRNPEPSMALPGREEVLAFKQAYREKIETCRFWMNYMIGATKAIPVALDFQTLDKQAAEDLSRVLDTLVGQTIKTSKITQKEDQDGNSGNNPA